MPAMTNSLQSHVPASSTRWSLPILLMLAALPLTGCSWGLSEEVAPPREAAGTFTLRLEGTDRADDVFEVEVRRAQPGDRLVLVVKDTTLAQTTCPEPLDPVCLSIQGEVVMEQEGVADSDGEAWWYVPFGMARGGNELSVQVYSASGWVSNGLILQIP